MPECYLCGDYIERGRGYRREVQIESSTRIYISRRPGSSFGTRTALRTLCRRCAKVEDKVAKGSGFRQFGYVVGFGLSVWLGWQIITHSEGAGIWIGLFFLLGLPVPVIAWMTESMSRRLAEGEVSTGISTLDLIDIAHPHAPRPAPRAERNDSPPFLARARSAGMPSEVLDEASFRANDTLNCWAARGTKALRSLPNTDPEFDESAFLMLAWYAKPHVGEGFDEYFQRSISRRADLEASFDDECTPQRRNEPFADYVARIAPHYLTFISGLSLEDIVPALVHSARCDPADAAGNVIEWIDRMLPRAIASILSAP